MPNEDIQNLTPGEPAPSIELEQAAVPDAVEAAADTITESVAGNDDLPTDKPQSDAVKALLDTISADAPAPAAAPEEKPEEPDAAADKPAGSPEEPKTLEQEEAELLEGVKSERGKDRIRSVFAERKQLEAEIGEIREIIQSTKMTPDQFAQSLEYGRLVNSGSEQDMRVALEMVEHQRAYLYEKLGVEAPGIDLLAGHDDLKAAVDNLEMSRDKAVELAKYRKIEAERSQQTKAQQQSQQATQEFNDLVKSAAQQAEAYLSTRANEVDHTARMKVISDHFRNPANLQQFVNTYQPNQWLNTIKFMYDSIQVPKAPVPREPQPLRSRPAALGTPAATGETPIDRIASRMDMMGL